MSAPVAQPPTVTLMTRTGEDAFLVAAARGPGDPAQTAAPAYAQLAGLLHRAGLSIVQERLFGTLAAEAAVRQARQAALVAQGISPDGPVTYIEGTPPWGSGWAGTIIHAVRTAQVPGGIATIDSVAGPCGRRWRCHEAEFIVLQGLHGADSGPGATRGRELGALLERADHLLREQGAWYIDVARTWFYIDDILGWYDEFNTVRSERYRTLGVWAATPSCLPASTGIAGRHSSHAAAAADLLAVRRSAASPVQVVRLFNSRQQEAEQYGSCFARGVAIRSSSGTLIEISGTAAVGAGGETLFPGDARAQIEWTLDTVAALLAPEGATLREIAAATAFVKRPGDAAVLGEVLTVRGLAQLPVVCVVADVCRADLLFELDAEALCPPRP